MNRHSWRRWTGGGLVISGLLFSTLTVAAQEGPTPKPRMNLEKAREAMAALQPPGTLSERDIPYIPDGHERQKLDLFVPPGTEPCPVIVWVHGGAWKGGDKGNASPAMAGLSRGYAVVSVNYRFKQHAPFPAQIQDCQAAIRWVRANAKKYRLDPERIAVWGASAGGHLVALLGTASDSTDWEAIGPNKNESARVQAVIDWFGPADFSVMGPLAMQWNSTLGELVGAKASDSADDIREKFRRASPVNYVTKDDAPFLIMQGDQDRLVPARQSELLHAKLEATGVPSELVIIPGAGHGGADFVNEANRSKIAAFLKQHLVAAPATAPATAP